MKKRKKSESEESETEGWKPRQRPKRKAAEVRAVPIKLESDASSVLNDDSDENHDRGIDSDGDVSAAKRRQDKAQESSGESSSPAPVQKRPVGRPRKPVVEGAPVPVKRSKVGRPPKVKPPTPEPDDPNARHHNTRHGPNLHVPKLPKVKMEPAESPSLEETEDDDEDEEVSDGELNPDECRAWYWCHRLYDTFLPDLIDPAICGYETWTSGCLTRRDLRSLCNVMKLAPFRPSDLKDPQQKAKSLEVIRWTFTKMVSLRLTEIANAMPATLKDGVPSVDLPDIKDITDVVIPAHMVDRMAIELSDSSEQEIREKLEPFQTGKPPYFKFLVDGLTASVEENGHRKRNMTEENLCRSDTNNITISWDRWVDQELAKDPSLNLKKSNKSKLPHKHNVVDTAHDLLREYRLSQPPKSEPSED